jgi:hypothetical protein
MHKYAFHNILAYKCPIKGQKLKKAMEKSIDQYEHDPWVQSNMSELTIR